MNNAANTAQILDFNTFRQQRLESQPADQNVIPMVVWYPVWVFVPGSQTPPSN